MPIRLVRNGPAPPFSTEELKKIFKRHDKDRDGRLDKEELTQAFQHLGAVLPRWRALGALRYADADGNGFISEDEMTGLVNYAVQFGYTPASMKMPVLGHKDAQMPVLGNKDAPAVQFGYNLATDKMPVLGNKDAPAVQFGYNLATDKMPVLGNKDAPAVQFGYNLATDKMPVLGNKDAPAVQFGYNLATDKMPVLGNKDAPAVQFGYTLASAKMPVLGNKDAPAAPLSTEQLKKNFKEDDKNGDGRLDKEELKKALQRLGAPGWRASQQKEGQTEGR